MNKAQLLKRLDKAWQAFTGSYAELSDSELVEPGVTGDWSVKDLIAHVTCWEAEALKYLPLILSGGRPPRYSVTYGGIDAFNDQMHEEKKDLLLAEVLQERDDTHQRLVELIREAPDEHVARETRFRRRLRLDSYSHYPEHTRAILEWRRAKSME